ncbi:MAG TPA: hypothetical protein VF543_22555 [Pyrinomonadaceae bacterium]
MSAQLEEVRRKRAEARAREAEQERHRHQLLEARDPKGALVGFSCACKLWGLNLPLGDETAVAAATADILQQHLEHAETESEVIVEWGYGVTCTPIVIRHRGHISTGWICGGRTRRKRCQACKKGWSVAQCDFPTGGVCKKCKGEGVKDGHNCEHCSGTGLRMCSRHLCCDCRAHVEPDEDYCPEHTLLAGLIKRELCEWTKSPVINSRKCLHRECEVLIAYGERVLFFPKKCRAMCEACGEMYLKIAV